jgi:hypothetical protein
VDGDLFPQGTQSRGQGFLRALSEKNLSVGSPLHGVDYTGDGLFYHAGFASRARRRASYCLNRQQLQDAARPFISKSCAHAMLYRTGCRLQKAVWIFLFSI